MRKAGDIVSALFRDRFGPGFMETARSAAGLFSSWPRIVTEVWSRNFDGDRSEDDVPAAAVHSRIRELERDLLLVEVDHPGWIQILQTKQKELLASVQRRHPDLRVKGIAFRLGKEPFSSQSYETPASVREPPQQDEASESRRDFEYAAPVKARRRSGDEEFHAALKSLGESVKKRNKRP